MASTTLRASQRPGRCWMSPMNGSKSKLHNKRGQLATILRWGIAPLLPHFSMRIGCIQSATDSQAFALTALDCLADRPSPAQLMRRDPTASYSLWALQIATSKRFELTALGLLTAQAGRCTEIGRSVHARETTGFPVVCLPDRFPAFSRFTSTPDGLTSASAQIGRCAAT